MTESQRHGIAAGFLHVIETHHDVYDRWSNSSKNPAALGKLIQEEMGLAAAPSENDLKAMAAYIDSHLQNQVERIHEAHSNAPKVGSSWVGVEQS